MIEQSNQSWATTLVGRAPEQVQPILDQFHEQEVSSDRSLLTMEMAIAYTFRSMFHP
jgi:hypothetical protein